jgi:hypothetical protein
MSLVERDRYDLIIPEPQPKGLPDLPADDPRTQTFLFEKALQPFRAEIAAERQRELDQIEASVRACVATEGTGSPPGGFRGHRISLPPVPVPFQTHRSVLDDGGRPGPDVPGNSLAQWTLGPTLSPRQIFSRPQLMIS